MASLHEFNAKTIAGKDVSLVLYEGSVALVVNVASECGATPQYEGLQALFAKYKSRGFTVLGFPCNQFGNQEPGTEAEIQEFCSSKYKVEFPMFSKVDVNGGNAHPLFEWLTDQRTRPAPSGSIKWNFEKFLIGQDGKVLARFDTSVTPDTPELVNAIEEAL